MAARLRRRHRRPGRESAAACRCAASRSKGSNRRRRAMTRRAWRPCTDDAVLDFDVTANRPDCMSVTGIAREVATAYGLPFRLPSASAAGHLRSLDLRVVDRDTFSVRIDAPDLCTRYVGAAADVRVGPSPAWLQRRLTALRRAADQQRRRRDQLRAARTRAADARVRSRAARRRRDRRAAGARRARP